MVYLAFCLPIFHYFLLSFVLCSCTFHSFDSKLDSGTYTCNVNLPSKFFSQLKPRATSSHTQPDFSKVSYTLLSPSFTTLFYVFATLCGDLIPPLVLSLNRPTRYSAGYCFWHPTIGILSLKSLGCMLFHILRVRLRICIHSISSAETAEGAFAHSSVI